MKYFKLNRSDHTTHGLHLNRMGKRKLSVNIAQTILKNLLSNRLSGENPVQCIEESVTPSGHTSNKSCLPTGDVPEPSTLMIEEKCTSTGG